MTERTEFGRLHEEDIPIELSPRPGVVDALRGTISEPTLTKSLKFNPEGSYYKVRMVTEGSGQFGLTDCKDNQEWADVFDQSLLSARYALHFAQKMTKAGYETNPQTILDAMIVSRAGQRTWTEAGWYPFVAPNAKEKRESSPETLGLRIIQGKVPQDVFNLLAAHANNPEEFPVDPEIYESWDYKLTDYVLHSMTGDETEEALISLGINPAKINKDTVPMPDWEHNLREEYIAAALVGIKGRGLEVEKSYGSDATMNHAFPNNTWWGLYAREAYTQDRINSYKPMNTDG